MAQVADIPIVGGLLDSLALYFRQTTQIVGHPLRFARALSVEERQQPKRALSFFIAGLVVTYLICIPAFIRHGSDVSQSLFIISMCLRLALLISIIHLTLKMLGSKEPLISTFIGYFYMAGLFIPLVILASLPVVIEVGPAVVFGNIDYQAASLPWWVNMSKTMLAVVTFLFFFIGITAIFYATVLLVYIHKLKVWKTILGIFIGASIFQPIFQFVYFPLWTNAEGWIKGMLRFL
jgi:hypothetical protein